MEEKKSPIRVAQIIGKWVGGGVESVVMNYYKNINHQNIQFDFICDEDSKNIPYNEIEKLGGKIILVPPYQQIFKYQKKLLEVLKKNKYTIVHSHINTLSVFPLRIAKIAGIPIRIAHSHSTTNRKEWKKNIVKQVLRIFSTTYATHYMCCSKQAGEWMFGKRNYNEGNVYRINNAIDVNKFVYNEKTRVNKRKELNLDEETIVIGNIGRFVRQKNHEMLIEIFYDFYKNHKNCVLILVGQGPLEQNVKNKVEKLGLKDNVKFLGQRKDVNEIYQLFDIFLFPSLYEGLGMVVIEAQCSGLSCIVSTEVPEDTNVINSVKFIDLKEKTDKWVQTMSEALNNKSKRGNYEKCIRKKGYEIKEEAKKLERIYLQLEGEKNDFCSN